MMTILGYSQIGYPKKIVYKRDTVVAITVPQMKYLNVLKVENDYLKNINSVLKASSVVSDSIISRQEFLLVNYRNERVLMDTINHKNKIIIDGLNTKISTLEKSNKGLRRRTGWLGVIITGLTAALIFN